MAQIRPEHARKRLGLRAPKAVAAAGMAALLSLGLVGVLRLQAPALAISSAPSQPAQDGDDDAFGSADGAIGEPLLLSEVVVHVDGAVERPGVYSLAGETVRICDAVDAAGGLAPDADTSSINLAQPITDGMKVHIPTFDEVERGAVQESGSAEGGLINLNTATVEELMQLPGIGEHTAQAIIDDRSRYGPYASVDDLLRVSGIGEKKLEKIRSYVCV